MKYLFDYYRDPTSFGYVVRGIKRLNENSDGRVFQLTELNYRPGEICPVFTQMGDEEHKAFYSALMDCMWGMGIRPSKKTIEYTSATLLARDLLGLNSEYNSPAWL